MATNVALWREVEAGTRHTVTTAKERYPQAQLHSRSFKGLPSEIARKPKIGNSKPCDVKTNLAADVEALVARLAAPAEPEAVDPCWREVETGTRYTQTTAMERYPQLYTTSFKDLPFEIARRPKPCKGPRDVKTYLAADVDALVARLAAPEAEPVDPRWCEVEAGTRYTQTTVMERYPQLTKHSCNDLPSEFARKPKSNTQRALDVRTYLASDVDALAARLAAPDPEPVDPGWRKVESGARYDVRTAKKRYPQLYWQLFVDLPFEIARRPRIGKARYAIDVKTCAAADIEALAAARATKRARIQEPEPPQEPEEEPEECPVCFDPMTGATATLVCGHLFCTACITEFGEQPDDVPDVPRDARGRPAKTSPRVSMRRLLVLCLVGAVSARGRPSLAGYLDACEGPGDAVHLRRWYGRTGNNLNQLANAFGVALASGRPYVSLPAAPPKGLDPAVWRAPPPSLPAGRRDGAFRCEVFESEPTYDCARLFRSRCRLSVAEKRVALRRAVDALLRPEALDACDAPAAGAVVAHVRDGDVARNDGDRGGRGSRKGGDHLVHVYAQPPCAYYDALARRFDSVVVVRDFAATLALAGNATAIVAVRAVTNLDYVARQPALRARLVANRGLDFAELCDAFDAATLFTVPRGGTAAAPAPLAGFESARTRRYGATLDERTCGAS
ncbi:hypothetical protein JL722_700 [Aureococcus anophagefferens]|nr:hypothetical protein JL722_700 [Aureococcus anophagefferens]